MTDLGPLVRQLQGAYRRGTGSPQGVVTAPPATVYAQSDTGEIWKKASGTGNTGWVTLAGGFTPISCQVVPGAGAANISTNDPFPFAGANWDTTGGSMWVVGTPTDILIPEDGIYDVHVRTGLSCTWTGDNEYLIQFGGNPSEVVLSGALLTSAVPAVTRTASGRYILTAGDTVQLSMQKASGPDIVYAANSHLTVTKVAPYV